MIHWIHHDAAHLGTSPEPAASTRFAQVYIVVVLIADLAYCGATISRNASHLAAGETQGHEVTFLTQKLAAIAG